MYVCSLLYPRKMKLRVPLHPAHVIALLVALFASPVQSITPPWSPSLHQGTTDDLITYYFNAGHQYIKIVYFLCIVHGLVISMRQLKRKLKRLSLRRRAPKTAANFRHVCHLIWVRYITNMKPFMLVKGFYIHISRRGVLQHTGLLNMYCC